MAIDGQATQLCDEQDSVWLNACFHLAQKLATDVIAAALAGCSGDCIGECMVASGRQSPADVHAVATAAVNSAVDEAVQDVAQTVVLTTEWLTQAVRGELLSQAVGMVINVSDTSEVATIDTAEVSVVSNGYPSRHDTDTRAVAEEIVHVATTEALRLVLCAVCAPPSKTPEIVSDDVAERDHHRLEVKEAHQEDPAVVVTVQVSTVQDDEKEDAIPSALGSQTLDDPVVDTIHTVAQTAVASVVDEALQDVALAVEGATAWLSQAVRGELLSKAVAEAVTKDDKSVLTTGAVPTLRLPGCSVEPTETSLRLSAASQQVAQPFVQQVISSALQQSVRTTAQAKDELLQQEETALSLPVASKLEGPKQEPKQEQELVLELGQEIKASEEPAASTELKPSEEWESVPPAVVLKKTPPPDKKRTPRRKTPVASPRESHQPTSTSKTPASAPPATSNTTQSLPVVPPLDVAPSQPEAVVLPSLLPPLELPGARTTPPSNNADFQPHQHKSTRKTPRSSQFRSPQREADSKTHSTLHSSPRIATSTSKSPREKNTPSTVGELEMTLLSSARAAARIYAEQPEPTPRCKHHHRKPPQRDAATQTSPRPSPLSVEPSRHHAQKANNDSDKDHNAARLKHVSSHSHELRDGAVKKSKPTTLLPLTKVPHLSPTTELTATKTTSPLRDSKTHGRSRRHREGGGGGHVSPSKMRSGYCQRCVFEGRSCKINDCIKHQLLK